MKTLSFGGGRMKSQNGRRVMEPMGGAGTATLEADDFEHLRGLQIAYAPDSGPGRAPSACPRVLIVDDDRHLLRALSLALEQRGFATQTAADAGEALAVIEAGAVDAVILDVMMPVVDGLQFCRLVRPRFEAPIMMLSAMDSVDQRVSGLESGADDYLAKPFAIEELIARLHALLKRNRHSERVTEIFNYEDVQLDTYRWEATRAGEPLSLTSKEFRILEVLMRSPGRVFSREEMLDAAWGADDLVESNAVDVHIATLRHKTEAWGGCRLIQTIRGVGYSLRE